MTEPAGGIDEPSPGAIVVRGPLTVAGWSAFGDQPAVAVVASIGPEIRGAALVGGQRRPDVAAALGSGDLVRSGWAVDVDLSDMPEGPVDIEITAWGGPGRSAVNFDTLPLIIRDEPVAPEEPETATEEGGIDIPRLHDEGEELRSGVVTIGGWALGIDGPVDEVQVFVDGHSTGRARLGLPRPDVFRDRPVMWARSAGFEQQVDLTGFAGPGPVRISAVASWSDGTVRLLDEGALPIAPVAPDSPEWAATPARIDALRRQPPWVATSRPPVPSDELDLLVVSHGLGYGGAQLWLTELLVKAGAGRDFPCTVLSPANGPLGSELLQGGIDLHVTRPFVVNDIEDYEGQVAELGVWARSRRHTAVLANTFDSFVGADVARRLGMPAVWAIHESWSPQAYWSTRYPPGHVDAEVRRVVDQTFGGTSAVVFEAEATRRLYLPIVRPGAAVVVPYGVDTTRIDDYCAKVPKASARSDLGLPEKGRIVLVMGTTEPRKSQLLVAEVFASLADDYPDTTLVLVGDTGNVYSDTLRDFVAGMNGRIWLVPVVTDPFPWYRSADMLLCASDIESLPRSVLEAMGFGLTVVATSVFGLPELLTDGQTGFLFEPRRRSALLLALRRVLDHDDGSLAQVGAAGRRHVASHYDSHGYAADILAILRGLLRDPQRSPAEFLANRTP